MDERYIASIDLGTSKIAVTVAQVNNQDVQVIYYKERPSQGIRNTMIFNPKKVSIPVCEAIREAQDELKIQILQVVVGLPRYYVRQETATAELPRSDQESSITQEEINYLKSNAGESYPLEDDARETIYGIVPQSFSADDYIQALESEIEGMVSSTLQGNFKVYIGNRRASSNVDLVMNNANLAAASKLFLPEVVAKAVLTTEEKENGVALVEIGAGATSVSIYHKKTLRYYASIPFGGNSVTNDIRSECGISDSLAENIKLAYGACLPEKLLTLRDKIIQIDNKVSGRQTQISVKYLSETITARMREIIEAILYLIEDSGMADSLLSGVVITGGGANLPNLHTMIKDMSGYSTRIGFPLSHRFSYSGCSGVAAPEAAASIGMILTAKEDTNLNCLSGPVPKEPEIEEEEEEEETEVVTGETVDVEAGEPEAAGGNGEGVAAAAEVTEAPAEQDGSDQAAAKVAAQTAAEPAAEEKQEKSLSQLFSGDEYVQVDVKSRKEKEKEKEKERKRREKEEKKKNKPAPIFWTRAKAGLGKVWNSAETLFNSVYDMTEDSNE